MPTETNVHGDALCFMGMGHSLLQRLAVGGWRMAVRGGCSGWWRLVAVGGPWGLSLRAVLDKQKPAFLISRTRLGWCSLGSPKGCTVQRVGWTTQRVGCCAVAACTLYCAAHMRHCAAHTLHSAITVRRTGCTAVPQRSASAAQKVCGLRMQKAHNGTIANNGRGSGHSSGT